jgi:hemoglobin
LRQGFAALNEGRPFEEIPLSPEPTPFARMGGADVVDALVERFYAEMDARPEAREVRALHAANLEPTKFVLKRYLGEWLGGPPLYSRDRGHPRLRMRHLRFPIGAAERDAWLACMGAALEATVADAQLRGSIFQAMAGLADHMRNRPADEERSLPAR